MSPEHDAPSGPGPQPHRPTMWIPRYDEESWSLLFVPGAADATPPWSDGVHVFVCAALQDPRRMQELTGRPLPFAPAQVRGFRRAMLDAGEGAMPFMLPSHDAHAALAGTLFLGLSSEELGGVEAFELAGGLRRRIHVDARVGERALRAVSYVRYLH